MTCENWLFCQSHWLAAKLHQRGLQPQKVFLRPSDPTKKMQSTLPDGTTIGWVFHVAAAYTDTLGTVNLSAATCISTETVQIGINASLVTDSLGNVGSGTSAVTYTAP